MLGKSNQYQKQITSIADNKTGFPRLSEEYDTVPFNGLILNGEFSKSSYYNKFQKYNFRMLYCHI